MAAAESAVCKQAGMNWGFQYLQFRHWLDNVGLCEVNQAADELCLCFKIY
jgi:hypothetical protein